jgi:hypothetical protein
LRRCAYSPFAHVDEIAAQQHKVWLWVEHIEIVDGRRNHGV